MVNLLEFFKIFNHVNNNTIGSYFDEQPKIILKKVFPFIKIRIK